MVYVLMNDKSKRVEIPSIKPARDQVASYRRGGRTEAPKQSNFNGMLVFSLVLMAIMMGVGGFTLFEVRQKLDQANQLLTQGQKNIRDLEDRLAATGTDVSKTLQVIQTKQETTFLEIDKLWKVAYRQNRPKLEELEKQVETVQAKSKTRDGSMETVIANLFKVTGDFTLLSDDIVAVRQGLIDDNSEMTTAVSLVRGQMQDQEDLVEGNRRSISSLEKKVSEVEEAIDVIDRYRQQVNQRLVDLQNKIQQEQDSASN